MAKDGSVAPKERINITFKPAVGGAQEDVELPLKLLVLGDFSLRADIVVVPKRSICADSLSLAQVSSELGPLMAKIVSRASAG